MMSSNDAERLLDENFIAMDDSFDRLDENNGYFAESNKYKKKKDLNFTSLWRKPKIGRRKTRSVGKQLVDSYDMTINEYDMPVDDDSKRGKVERDRESFDSFTSVPLSDFDNVKDNLAFLNLRSNNLNKTKSPKKNLNPKMFLTQPPVNRRDIKNKFKKDRVTKKKVEEEESRDIFKSIHNTKNDVVFDAFQIIPKESLNKTKQKEDAGKKQKEEEADDLFDKENLPEESFYDGGLYQDHGPILSSLSEDTLHSDSIRGEQFLPDEMENWNPILSPKFEELEKGSWEICGENNKMVVPQTEPVESISRPTKVETSARSFNDRLKLFQSKGTQPTEKVRSDPMKSKPISPKTTQLMEKYGVKAPETEVRDYPESAVVPKKSVPEKISSEQENCDKSSAISKPDEHVTAKVNEMAISKAKSYSVLPYKSHIGNNRFKEMRTNTGTKFSTSSYLADNYKHNNETKNFSTDKVNDTPKKKILVPESERTQSKAVDLSMLETFRTQATIKSIERDTSISQQRNSTDPSLCSEKEVEKESSTSNRFQRMSELSTRSTRSYSSNYRSSLHSQKSTYSKPTEAESKPEIEKVTKFTSSEGLTVSSDQSKDHSNLVEMETKNTETKKEKPTDSFMAARSRFGGKLQHRNTLERKIVSSIRRTASKEENSEEKKETTDNSNLDNVSQSLGKKSFGSLSSEANADRTSISSTGTQKSTVRPSFIAKSSFDPTPKKTNVGYKKPSFETSMPSTNVLDARSLESENETGEKRETSNESTANTSISTLTCESAPPTSSFAQQSASIFGVTLSKRKKRVESASESKKSQATEKATAINVVAKKSDVNTVSDKLQTTNGVSDPVEKTLSLKEKQNNLNDEGTRRKISTSSVSIHSVEMKKKNETSNPKQEEKPRVVEKATSVPRKAKPSSIADRLKMFEKPKVTSQNVSDNDGDNTQDAVQSDSPKSVQSSESSSSFEVSSVATKRRDSDSGTISECSEVKHVETSPHRKNVIGKGTDDFGERRRTLKSIKGTTSTSSFSKPQQASRLFEKPEVHKKNDITFGNGNSLRNRLSTLRALKSECREALKSECREEPQVEVPQKPLKSENEAEIKVELTKKSVKSEEKAESKVELPGKPSKEPSAPTRDAYSMRRKFFENLDRKRVLASMSRPLITQTESMSTSNKFQKEHEIEIIGDGILHENNDLPIMCVEFEEDFVLKDNISTCLSASENRSVVCKPDALLYSVSQRALGLMSQKAESSSLRSYGRTYREEDKGTIDNGLKFNRFKSSGNIGSSSSNSELRNRFDRKNNEKEVTDNAQEENKQTNKFRTSEFSQRCNRFTGNKVTSEVRRQSNDDDDDTNDKKYESSIEVKKSIEKSTTFTTFNQPKDIGSMSISERLAFFESQRKKRSASTKKLVEKEEPTVLDDSRKSSVSQASSSSSFKNGIKKFRPSEASEMTPLAGARFADQSFSSRNLKRVSSTSMGTLDYSMNSSSYSRPSEVSKSSNTYGPSHSRFSRK